MKRGGGNASRAWETGLGEAVRQTEEPDGFGWGKEGEWVRGYE